MSFLPHSSHDDCQFNLNDKHYVSRFTCVKTDLNAPVPVKDAKKKKRFS